MANRERPRDRGTRRASEALADLGRQCRDARTASDLTQAAVARAAGVDRSWLSRFERGDAGGIGFVAVGRLLAVVGLDLSVRAYPGGDALRDAPQLGLVGRFRSEVAASVGLETEVPLPMPGDPRAWDAFLRFMSGARWGVEGETRVGDVQARVRSLQRKKRDGRVDGVILLLGDTAHHRAMFRDHGALLRSTFPVASDEALADLRAGRPPRGDTIILI